ncbi:hypothetical protein [Sinimarinibacterium sp. NLF-5-8]|uniref:hypothetical protein n=1 Tax=Sinimarinibacterium sp. NLF-5-8 TaxID=2698684 RepID=UPI00137B9E77|nr:hypothetical protein [Sinimarinibacterium sp. NLF-5-8]QHS09899.1 hypothetical protein GT972_06875 [Sinimarinibacterium sp. NLF-5-8]
MTAVALRRLFCVVPPSAALVAALAVAGCDINGLGSGDAPQRLDIVRGASAVAQVSPEGNVVYRCFVDQLQAVVTFKNGGIDIGQGLPLNNRITWISSDPQVIEVSNECDPQFRRCDPYPAPGSAVPFPGTDGAVFGPGVLIPHKVGTATITAEFVGLTASYDVQVRDIDRVEISPSVLTMAPATSSQLKVVATVEGYPLEINNNLTWRSDETGEAAARVLTVENASDGTTIAGRLIANRLGSTPIRVSATPILCADEAPFNALHAQVQVEPLQSLRIAREFADAPNDQLIFAQAANPSGENQDQAGAAQAVLTTNESIQATGVFDSGAEQDLTGQVLLESSDPEVVAPIVIGGLVVPLSAGSVQITARYGGSSGDDESAETGDAAEDAAAEDGGEQDQAQPLPLVISNALTLNTVAGELQSIDITPDHALVSALDSQRFAAIGHFSVNGATQTQPITRQLLWSVTDANDAVTLNAGVVSSGLQAGTFVSALVKAETFKLKAQTPIATSADASATLSAETLVCVVPRDVADASCPPSAAADTP